MRNLPWIGVWMMVLMLAGEAIGAEPVYLWIEGEDAAKTDAKRHGWYNSVKAEELSGGSWLSHFSEDGPATAVYRVTAPRAGDYHFWVRANPINPKLSYRLNNGEWAAIDMGERQRGRSNIASDGKPDLRFIAWAYAGQITLKRAANTLEFKFHSKNQNHGGLDCFLLTDTDFVPTSKRKPGESSTDADPGYWAFDPAWDHFGEEALLDLRGLNEKTAGQSGFVRASKDGASFVLGNGEPARFWSVTSYGYRLGKQEDIEHHARFLAKRGVNMHRLHLQISPPPDEGDITVPRRSTIDAAHRSVAAMKKQGIYTTLSPYWAFHAKKVPKAWGIAGWPEDRPPQGLLFFNPTLQAAYKAWLKELLTRPNPHTGIPLRDDPALAVIQLQNEDSLLFWTERMIEGEQRELLGTQFATWLEKKYGSLAKAYRAWDGFSHEDDRLGDGVVGLHIIWHQTRPAGGGKARRLADQLAFYSETMQAFNSEITRYLRDELDCKQLINAGNWKTADVVQMEDAERWSYTATDIVATNRYHTRAHVGEAVGWSIRPGQHFAAGSALQRPLAIPVNMKQAAGRINMVTESRWVPPNPYQSEGPFLVSAYSSLTGLDSFYWFQVGDAEWGSPISKWSVATPMELGQFPAAALMFRKGYLKQGKPVVVEHRSLEDLWLRRSPLIAEGPSYDPNRDKGSLPPKSSVKTRVDPLAFLVGPVEMHLGSDASRSRVSDLGPYIDKSAKRVRSNTGELVLDHGKGLCTINAPNAQGVTGFLKDAGPIKLGALTVVSRSEYATLLAVSLDGGSLMLSRRVLLQAGTTARPYGWKQTPATFKAGKDGPMIEGWKIKHTGGQPWNIAELDAAVFLANPAITRAVALDGNGYARRDLELTRTDKGVKLKMPADALYVVLMVDVE